MPQKVGVVAIQGDFERHAEALRRCATPPDVVFVKTPDDLVGVERVIVPGGESTTVGLLMQRFGLGEALIEAVEAGMPVLGTCMGMILMARDVVERNQYCLGMLDIEVERNAFGAQVHSFEADVSVRGFDDPIRGVFIRAPAVSGFGEGVERLAEFEGRVVAVRQDNRVGLSFHPELTEDPRMHEWFLRL
jgi:5'-phosphate synthase pdxT subunit